MYFSASRPSQRRLRHSIRISLKHWLNVNALQTKMYSCSQCHFWARFSRPILSPVGQWQTARMPPQAATVRASTRTKKGLNALTWAMASTHPSETWYVSNLIWPFPQTSASRCSPLRSRLAKLRMAGRKRSRQSFADSGWMAKTARIAKRSRAVASRTVRKSFRRKKVWADSIWHRCAKIS